MKRTRRVEVIRYSRRTTVVQGESAAAGAAAEQRTGDLILDVLGSIPPLPEQPNRDDSIPDGAAADHPPGRRSFFRLGDLLRLRK